MNFGLGPGRLGLPDALVASRKETPIQIKTKLARPYAFSGLAGRRPLPLCSQERRAAQGSD